MVYNEKHISRIVLTFYFFKYNSCFPRGSEKRNPTMATRTVKGRRKREPPTYVEFQKSAAAAAEFRILAVMKMLASRIEDSKSSRWRG